MAAELHGLDGAPVGPVLLDFEKVKYVISEDLGALVGLHKRVQGQGGRLTLVNVCPLVGDVLSITRLDTLFDVHHAIVGPAANGASQ